MKLPGITVFFPCYNDGEIIPYLVKRIYQVLPKVCKDYEVLVVNDGSTDDSAEVLSQLKKNYKNFRIISHEKNLGYGAALKSGFSNARKEWVFYTDGDGQYDPKDLVKLVKKVSNNIDVVNGYKLARGDSWIRKIAGNLYNFLLQGIYHLPISDIDCDFRLIRRSCLQKVELTVVSGAVCLELIVKLQRCGARFTQVPVGHFNRPVGRSQFFKIRPVARLLMDNLKLILRKSQD